MLMKSTFLILFDDERDLQDVRHTAATTIDDSMNRRLTFVKAGTFTNDFFHVIREAEFIVLCYQICVGRATFWGLRSKFACHRDICLIVPSCSFFYCVGFSYQYETPTGEDWSR